MARLLRCRWMQRRVVHRGDPVVRHVGQVPQTQLRPTLPQFQVQNALAVRRFNLDDCLLGRFPGGHCRFVLLVEQVVPAAQQRLVHLKRGQFARERLHVLVPGRWVVLLQLPSHVVVHSQPDSQTVPFLAQLAQLRFHFLLRVSPCPPFRNVLPVQRGLAGNHDSKVLRGSSGGGQRNRSGRRSWR